MNLMDTQETSHLNYRKQIIFLWMRALYYNISWHGAKKSQHLLKSYPILHLNQHCSKTCNSKMHGKKTVIQICSLSNQSQEDEAKRNNKPKESRRYKIIKTTMKFMS